MVEEHTTVREFATAKHVRNEQCPKCAENGRDRSRNNLGVFDDGSCYCWSCGYYQSGSLGSAVKRCNEVLLEVHGRTGETGTSVALPDDVEPFIPSDAVVWIRQYDLDINDLYVNRCLWSEVLQRLIFPYRESPHGPVLGWQGRYFGKESHTKHGKRIPKWWGVGHLDSIYHIFNRERSRDLLVIVEDVVSAYKVAKYIGLAAMPLFGSHISPKKLLALKLLTDHVYLFLDPDKLSEAVKFSSRGNMLGLPTKVIKADADPKELSPETLKELLLI